MLLTNLRELKKTLELDDTDTVEDLRLTFLVEQASAWIEELIGRKLEQKSRTEFYGGDGTPQLTLRSRPLYATPTPQVWVDENAYFGTASGAFDSTTALTYGTGFCVDIDQDDGFSSRSGILIRIGGVWPRAVVRRHGLLSPSRGPSFGSIKVTYTAGFTEDTLPPQLRAACNFLVARMRYVLPLGVELNSENYQERSISVVTQEKSKLLALVWPLILPFRNWKW